MTPGGNALVEGDRVEHPAPGSDVLGAPPALRRPLGAGDGRLVVRAEADAVGDATATDIGPGGSKPLTRPAGETLRDRAVLLSAALLGAALGLQWHARQRTGR